jgi:hypothetical protein
MRFDRMSACVISAFHYNGYLLDSSVISRCADYFRLLPPCLTEIRDFGGRGFRAVPPSVREVGGATIRRLAAVVVYDFHHFFLSLCFFRYSAWSVNRENLRAYVSC